MPHTRTTRAIAEALGGTLQGRDDLIIRRVRHPADSVEPDDIVLATDPSLLPLVIQNKPRAVIVAKDTLLDPGVVEACITVQRPRLAMAKLTTLFAHNHTPPVGVHPTAIIEDGAKIGQDVTIGAYAYIAADAQIGDHSVLHPQTYVGADARIGAHALIYSGVRVGERVVIGDNAIIHFNASIGADGFSFVTPQLGSVEAAKSTGNIGEGQTNQQLVRIASLGSVIIGNNVEIGANTSIDRGTIASTRIGNGTKIDNQVQIGHNVVVGENCMLCGRVGIAGSAEIGNRVVLGGATGVADHVKIGDDAIAMGMSGIAGNVPARSIVGGTPAVPRTTMVENLMNQGRLKQFFKKFELVTQRITALEKKLEKE